MAKTTETLELGGHTLSLTNRDKVLWPDDGYTKGDLVAYYRAMAPYILPHLRRSAADVRALSRTASTGRIVLRKARAAWLTRTGFRR